jgi:hypothetical protein
MPIPRRRPTASACAAATPTRGASSPSPDAHSRAVRSHVVAITSSIDTQPSPSSAPSVHPHHLPLPSTMADSSVNDIESIRPNTALVCEYGKSRDGWCGCGNCGRLRRIFHMLSRCAGRYETDGLYSLTVCTRADVMIQHAVINVDDRPPSFAASVSSPSNHRPLPPFLLIYLFPLLHSGCSSLPSVCASLVLLRSTASSLASSRFLHSPTLRSMGWAALRPHSGRVCGQPSLLTDAPRDSQVGESQRGDGHEQQAVVGINLYSIRFVLIVGKTC